MSHGATILGIDAGTTGVAAIAFDRSLRPVARAYTEFPQSFPEPGRVEHDAQAIRYATDEVVTRVLRELPDPPRAIGITNQRETVFALDAESGEALAPGIVWQDRRTASRCAELGAAGYAESITRKTGLVLDPYFSGTKIEWMLRENERVRDAHAAGRVKFVTVDGLLVHHLTRGVEWRTDPSNASRTMLFDIEERRYDDELCALFGIDGDPGEVLATVTPSAGHFGDATRYGDVAIPIHGILGDQQAALFGQGGVERGALKTTYGTGCFLVLNTGDERAHSKAGLLSTLCAGPRGEVQYALEGSAFAGGAVIQWLRDGLGLLDSASDSEALARSVDDTAGVVLVPAFAGLGAPHWDADARAAILGLTRGTTKAHIVRAGLDAIAHQCADLIEALRTDSGAGVSEMLVDGGAAANDYLMQRQAHLAQVKVIRPPEVEATARGAAAIAALGAGLVEDPAAVLATSGSTEFDPRGTDERFDADRRAWNDAVARIKSN